MKTAEHFNQAAGALREKLAAINILDLPVMSRERSLPRKEQAALCRKLFKQIGLKGISVTAPNYSMAKSVDVSLPSRSDYKLNVCGMVEDWATDPASMVNSENRQRIQAVLLAAFPRHEDRSDTQSDHFDYRWSIS